jgi:hypothetical protein
MTKTDMIVTQKLVSIKREIMVEQGNT